MAADIDRYTWFKTVVLPHEPALLARLRRIVRNRDDVEDLAAETMARAYASTDFTRIDRGRAFLFQIARNLIIDIARRDKIVSFDVVADLDLLHVDNSVEAGLHARDELRRLKVIVDTLPPQCRRVFLLRRVHDRSMTEIAEELGLSVSTVEKHLTKAITRIMQAIRDREDADVERYDRGHEQMPDRRGCGATGR
ncbi:RNA polymerase sigma factor [Sphingomonas sp. OK281]|uniref:RNA polymerase sigma factor n=1 Tax=Sphingomonas sp. OK281 TaxID=1881067 RepID=UPI0008E4C0CE|nr:sigma-70 family RNA polymerase sigma factor [Sphingomonas sp. OK281]SFN84764.1 RNA polymerase sigma-70 factor, ECF subfamily [Sphingomonas sp. OK281]